MSILKYICLLIIFVSAVKSDIQWWGSCPTYTRQMDSFDLKRYTGKWYEIAREKHTPFQKGDCTSASYSINDNGTLKVVNSELLPNGEFNSAIGTAYSTKDPFVFEVFFSDSFFAKLFPGDYQVVDTDYESYSVVYSCTSIALLARIEFYWILSRTPKIESDKSAELVNLLSQKVNVTSKNLRFTNQEKEVCGK